ncbi:MAG: hypothetical protein AAB815_03555 [Patescibacteria group bacterium]
MKKSSFHILRVGMAITFLWIGILIFKNPEAWGGFVQPWVVDLLPMSLTDAMMGTAVLDIVIGTLLLVDILTHWAALVGAGHLLIVLLVSGINDVTVRDIAIFTGAFALFNDSLPEAMRVKLMFWKKPRP